MRSDVEKIFDESLERVFGSSPNVLKFLKLHERKQICLNNLCAEIITCEKRSLIFNAEHYREVIYEVAVNMFARKALEHAEQKAMSSAERGRREDEARRIEIAKEEIKEFEGGIYKSIIEDDDSQKAVGSPDGL